MTHRFLCFFRTVCRDVSGSHEVALSQRACLLRAQLLLVLVFTTLKMLNIKSHFPTVSLFGTILSIASPTVVGYTDPLAGTVCSKTKQKNCDNLM
jgi:hypothetical protein